MGIDVSVFRLVSGAQQRPSVWYNLHVSNLEDEEFEYVVEYCHRPHDNVVIGPARFRGVERTYTPAFGQFIATHAFIVRPHETTVVELRVAAEEEQKIDISGHVRLRLPRKRGSGNNPAVGLGPQFSRPVKVLLHAETVSEVSPSFSDHGRVVDQQGYVLGRFGSAGTFSPLRNAVGLTLASGCALNEVPPDGSFVIGKDTLVAVSKVGLEPDRVPAKAASGVVPDQDRAAALMELLSELSADDATIDEVNRLLSDAQRRVRIGSSENA